MSCIALDLDGTLVDCRERQCQLASALCRAMRLPFDISAFWACKRDGATTRQALAVQGIAADCADRIAKLWTQAIENDHWLRLDREIAGATPALHRARAAGADLHLITARNNTRAVVRQLAWLGWADVFASVIVVSPRSASEQKARHLGRLKPDLFIGDSETDCEAADSAGIRFANVLSGQRSAGFWRAHRSAGRVLEYLTVVDALKGVKHAD